MQRGARNQEAEPKMGSGVYSRFRQAGGQIRTGLLKQHGARRYKFSLTTLSFCHPF